MTYYDVSREGDSGQERDMSNIFGTVPPVLGQLATTQYYNHVWCVLAYELDMATTNVTLNGTETSEGYGWQS